MEAASLHDLKRGRLEVFRHFFNDHFERGIAWCRGVQDVLDPSIGGIAAGTEKNIPLFVSRDVISCEILFHSFNIRFPITGSEVKFSKEPVSSHYANVL